MGVVRSSLIIGSFLLLTAIAGGIDASITAPSFIRTENHPVTPVTEPAAGLFLVARRELDDPHFAQSVIYLLRHGPQGTAGLIINRPSGLNLSDTVSDIEATDFESRPVFFGGPVEFNTVSMLIRNAQESRLVEHIADDVYLSGDRGVLDRLLTEKKPDRMTCTSTSVMPAGSPANSRGKSNRKTGTLYRCRPHGDLQRQTRSALEAADRKARSKRPLCRYHTAAGYFNIERLPQRNVAVPPDL